MLKIKDIKTENLREPLGVDTAAPLFSWIAESDLNDTFQTSARVCVRTDGETVWDSGEISCFGYEPVRYAGKPLSPKTRYEITVFIKDNHGRSAGGSSLFETGLMREFVGAWISY